MRGEGEGIYHGGTESTEGMRGYVVGWLCRDTALYSINSVPPWLVLLLKQRAAED